MSKKLKKYLVELVQYMEECGVQLQPYPSVKFDAQSVSAPYIYSPTGYYDPNKQHITLYTRNRHPKDILRSFAHELIHHNQYLTGKLFSDVSETSYDPKYTQNNKHLRKMEIEAYAKGNILFRDWLDNKQYGR